MSIAEQFLARAIDAENMGRSDAAHLLFLAAVDMERYPSKLTGNVARGHKVLHG